MRRLLLLPLVLVLGASVFAPAHAAHGGGRGWGYDINKNGVYDAYFEDHNENGVIDSFLNDENENAWIEGKLIDGEEDGFWETAWLDSNENGYFEEKFIRAKENNQWRYTWKDKNEDGCDDSGTGCATVGGNRGQQDYWYREQQARWNEPWLREHPDKDGDGWRNDQDRYPDDKRYR